VLAMYLPLCQGCSSRGGGMLLSHIPRGTIFRLRHRPHHPVGTTREFAFQPWRDHHSIAYGVLIMRTLSLAQPTAINLAPSAVCMQGQSSLWLTTHGA
jgi:hypothetical protein